MKPFAWNEEKNRQLQENPHRQISFEQLVAAILGGGLRDVLATHRPQQYPSQRRYIVELHGEIYVVPFVESETEIFLITAHPDRKMRKCYLR